MLPVYLTSDEAAAYLRIKERKLYELVGSGRIPATKMSGKWLFPRALLDQWLEAGLVVPPGFTPANPPMIIAGSQDPLLDWAARRSGSGLALLAAGSEAGLRHLARQEAAMAAIHLHRRSDETALSANAAAILAAPDFADCVLIRFVERQQGLLFSPQKKVASLQDAIEAGFLFGQRQNGAGAQLLFEKSVASLGLAINALRMRDTRYATGEDLAFAVASGEVDAGLASLAVAQQAGLAFVPLVWEAFDLVVRRRLYFEPALQAFFAFLRTPAFHAHAAALGGYRTAETGHILLNR